MNKTEGGSQGVKSEQSLYLPPPRYDANFKAIFSEDSEEGHLALKSFLEAILNAKVFDIQLIRNELPIEAVYDKQSVFDIQQLQHASQFW